MGLTNLWVMVKLRLLPRRLLLEKVIEMKESKTMKEIYEIRERHYEATKRMTRDEYILSIRARAAHSRLKVMSAKKVN